MDYLYLAKFRLGLIAPVDLRLRLKKIACKTLMVGKIYSGAIKWFYRGTSLRIMPININKRGG